MRKLFILLLMGFSSIINAQTENSFPKLSGDYLGQNPPGIIPKVFAPGIVSDSLWAEHCQLAISPNGDEIFWSVYSENFARKEGPGSTEQLLYSKRKDGIWTKPRIAEFTKSNRYGNNGGPVFSPDGTRLFFYQSEPVSVSTKLTYYVDKIDGEWSSQSVNAGQPYNTYIQNWTPIFTERGNAYKYSPQKKVIVKYKYDSGKFSNPDTLIVHKDFLPSFNVYVSPDEEYMIFASNQSDGYGNLDLYITFKTHDDMWGYPLNMGDAVNSEHRERFPTVSPDGKYLFFVRHTPTQDIFWVSTVIIEELKKIHLAKTHVEKSMVFVRGGTLTMGGDGDNNPVRDVTVNSYYISKYEVTQREYDSVMGKSRYYSVGDNNPAETVNWYNAIDFCNALSISQGLTPCYSGSGSSLTCDFTANGYRLPTEAEWEYAARGGVHYSDNFKYSGTSDDLEEFAWYCVNSEWKSHPVGEKSSNQLGLFDMSGNVWEWCWDLYERNLNNEEHIENPKGPVKGTERVVRGGGWNDYSEYCRSIFRYPQNPNSKSYCIGFRVVRSVN